MGILLLVISFALGYCLIKNFIPLIKRPVMLFSGAFLIGCLISGVVLYLLDLLFAHTLKNYILGSIVFMIISTAYIVYAFKRHALSNSLYNEFMEFIEDRWIRWLFIIFLAFSTWMMYITFNTKSGNINCMGADSDVMFHHSLVRAVASGNNVPVEFPYLAGTTVHYHFLFDYYSGKMAQLWMNSVHAYNLMSMLSLLFLLMLITEFGRVYFKSTAVGVLGASFLMLHSSLSGFEWLRSNFAGVPLEPHSILNAVSNTINGFIHKSGFLTGARFEDWGLFGPNMFLSVRHLSFALGVAAFVVIYLVQYRETCTEEAHSFTAGALKRNIFLAVIVGSLPFWNAVMAAILLIFMGAFALTGIRNRNFFFGMIYTSIVAGLIVAPQLLAFKSGDTTLSGYPKFYPGFALETFSFAALFEYYFRVLGIKLAILGLSLIIVAWKKKLDFIILLIPFAIANIFQIGFVLFDNNKLMLTSLVFLNCFAAFVIVWMFKKLPRFLAFLPVIICFFIILAGSVDMMAVKNLETLSIADKNSALKQWVATSTSPGAVFLTKPLIPRDDNSMTSIVLAGRKLYCVRNNVDAMCNLDGHHTKVKMIYEFSGSPTDIKEMVEREKIDYIIIDKWVRTSDTFNLNEKAIVDNFKLVKKIDGASEVESISIYSTGS